jgi:hypothetical protein
MKTTILCFLLVSGLFGLSFSCCSDIPDYWDLTSFNVEPLSFDRSTTLLNDSITTDTLVLRLTFGQEFLSDNIHLGPNPFIGTAHALSCSEPGELGMKDELVDINITSSAPFNNYSAGSSLTPMLFIGGQSIQSWIDNKIFNHYYGYRQHDWQIMFPIKPSANSSTHDFKVSLTFDSGRVEEVQLGAFNWN